MAPGRPKPFALISLAQSIVRALARETLRDSLESSEQDDSSSARNERRPARGRCALAILCRDYPQMAGELRLPRNQVADRRKNRALHALDRTRQRYRRQGDVYLPGSFKRR